MDFIPQFGNLAFTLAAFVAALSIIVAIHEYGHYIVGRWSGIHAEVFSLGFGPVLFRRTDRHGTVWQVAALPFGGYVKFLGDANAASVGSVTGAAGARLTGASKSSRTRSAGPKASPAVFLWARSGSVSKLSRPAAASAPSTNSWDPAVMVPPTAARRSPVPWVWLCSRR
jgi:regulator of sigma E protease